MVIEVYSGNFGNEELGHLLKRCLFGVKQAELVQFAGQPLTAVVDYLLEDKPMPNPPLKYYPTPTTGTGTDNNVAIGETWVNSGRDTRVVGPRRTSLKSWWIGLMINQEPNLREKMTLFWHNHFVIEFDNGIEVISLYKYVNILRSMAFGDLKDFTKQITLSAAMLQYLNGASNKKAAPDENYARELQELFTIGKGSGAHFTESDVKEAARVLTGFSFSNATSLYSFNASNHDTGNKQFSGFYNNTVITGKTGANGALELDDLLNMIFLQNEVALFICRKLYINFVYYEITPEAEQQLIVPLAEIFRANNYQIKPVLKALFTSSHFFLPQNMGCKIKSPIDFVVGLAREYNMVFPQDGENQYAMWNYLLGYASQMGQNLGDPPNVAGWPAYYQEPQFHELWINSDTLPRRNTFTDQFIDKGYAKSGVQIVIDPLAYTAQFAQPEDPDKLVNDVLAHLYTIEVNAEVKAFLKSILLSNQTTNNYWTDAWLAYKATPNDNTRKTIILTRLKTFYKYLMNLEEYQLS